MKRRFLLLLLTLFSCVCLLFGLAACDKDDVDGTYYQYKNGQIDKSLWIKLDNGEWTDDEKSSGTYKIKGDTITFYVELFGESEELCDGTLENGKLTLNLLGMKSVYYKDGKMPAGGSSVNQKTSSGTPYSSSKKSSSNAWDEEDSSVYAETYAVTYNAQGGEFAEEEEIFTQENVRKNAKVTAPTSPTKTGYSFAGWAKDKNGNTMWDFSADKVTENITLYAIWRQKSGVLLSVDGASIEGTEVFMFVEKEVDSVSLASKVVCSDDSSWRLYYDKLGQTEIPTKIAANTSGELHGGDNEFYIVVTSQDAVQVNVYTLTIHRSHAITVRYMRGDNAVDTDTAYTGETYAASYTPSFTGYTFNGWKTETGRAYQTQILWEALVLYADITANTYTVTYDENGGEELSAESKTVTYNSSYNLARPTRTGYTFLGWYYGSTALTGSDGYCILVWTYTNNLTVKAKWQANTYTVTYDENGGNELSTGSKTVTYDSSYTLAKPTRTGYTFLGWYYGNTALTAANGASLTVWKYTNSLTVTAKWTNANTITYDENGGDELPTDTETVTYGQDYCLKTPTRAGYTFVGWYYGNTALTNANGVSLSPWAYTQNITVTAKYTSFMSMSKDIVAAANRANTAATLDLNAEDCSVPDTLDSLTLDGVEVAFTYSQGVLSIPLNVVKSKLDASATKYTDNEFDLVATASAVNGDIYTFTAKVLYADYAIGNENELRAFLQSFATYDAVSSIDSGANAFRYAVFTDNVDCASIDGGLDVAQIYSYSTGNAAAYFFGYIDGRGHTINNIKATHGVFAQIFGGKIDTNNDSTADTWVNAVVKNIGFMNVAKSTNNGGGIFANEVVNATIDNVYVQGKRTTWDTNGSGFASFLSGASDNPNKTVITNVVVDVEFTYKRNGGQGPTTVGDVVYAFAGGQAADTTSKVNTARVSISNCYAVSATTKAAMFKTTADAEVTDGFYAGKEVFAAEVTEVPASFNSEYWIIGARLGTSNTLFETEATLIFKSSQQYNNIERPNTNSY